MKTRLPKLLLFLFLIALNACNDNATPTNDERFLHAGNEIIYEAPESIQNDTRYSLFPTAIAPYTLESILFLDSGTRSLVEFNTSTQEKSIRLNLAPYEEAIHPELSFKDDWGNDILRLDTDLYLISSYKRRLIFLDLSQNSVEIIGQIGSGKLPEHGTRLDNVDFSTYSGIGKMSDGLILSFGSQIYKIDIQNYTSETLRNAILLHIAGDSLSHQTNTHDALEIHLNLNEFTHFIEANGYIFFWDYPELKVLHNGHISTITGGGYRSLDGSLETFYAYSLPDSPPIMFHHGYILTPYQENPSAILKITIDQFSTVEDRVDGNIEVVWPDADTISGWTRHQNDIISFDKNTGKLFKIDGETLKAVPIQNISRVDADSAMDDIIAPQTMVPILAGNGFFTYSPSLSQLSFLDPLQKLSMPLMNIQITHMTSDNLRQAWLAHKQTLHILQIEDNGNVISSYVPHFFTSPENMGAPCEGLTLQLTEAPRIFISGQRLVFWTPQASTIFQYQFANDTVDVLHSLGWLSLSPSTYDFYFRALNTENVQFWRTTSSAEAFILNNGTEQILAIANLTSKDLNIVGHQIPKNKIHIIAGFGTTPLSDGIHADEAYFDEITDLEMDENNTIYLIQNNLIYTLSDDGVFHLSQLCSLPPNAEIKNFHIQMNNSKAICFANINNKPSVYIDNAWQSLEGNSIHPCVQSNYSVLVSNHQYCIMKVPDIENMACRTIDESLSVFDVACSRNSIYLSVFDGENFSIQRLSSTSSMPEPIIGTGNGLPEHAEIQSVHMGETVGNIVADNAHHLYFWLKDTCSLWRMDTDKEIEATTEVTCIYTGPHLCTADAFAINSNGELSFIDDNALYLLNDDGLLQYQTHVQGKIIDMTGFGGAFIIMTSDGIFSWEDDRLRMHAGNPIRIDGQTIQYSVAGSAHPRIIQSPDENAVLIPVFDHNRIIKVGLN